VCHFLFFDQFIIIVLFLFLNGLVINEIPLKGRHFFLAIHRRILIGPDVPHDILAIFMLFLIILLIVTFSGVIFKNIVEFFSCVFSASQFHFTEISVLIQRHASVIEQIGIIAQIHASLI